jgi:hypothetical protein
VLDVKYFPSFAQLSSMLRVRSEVFETKRKIAIGADVLKELITRALISVDFDPEWYLATYPDVKEAYEKGRIQDLKEHFISSGYFEGRQPQAVKLDEKWYLKNYPDIREAIGAGRVRSAEEHYTQNGQIEWRSPNPDIESSVVRWSRLASQV